MSEKVNGAPKSTETNLRLNNQQEAQPSESREYFTTAVEYFNDINTRRTNEAGQEGDAATAEYNELGGRELDQLRAQLANDPGNEDLQKRVAYKEATVYESYLNRNNEYAQLSGEDRGEVANMIAPKMPAEDDPKLFQKLLALETSLIADGGLTRTQVQHLFTEAAARKEHLAGVRTNEAPTGLPTTAELKKNEGKLNWRQKARRLLGIPSVYAGLGIAKLIDATQRRNEQYQKKSLQQEGETKEQYEKRLRKYDRNATLGAVAIGAALIGVKALTKSEAFDGVFGGGSNKPEVVTLAPDGGTDTTTDARGELDQYGRHMDTNTHEADGGGQTEAGGSSEFIYNATEDPFYDENKTGVNNYGAPLEADPEFDVEGVPGTAELRDSLIDSPNQLAVASAEMMQEGFSRDNLDGMGMELMNNPDFAEMSYDQIAAILDSPETKFSNGVLEAGTYGSYYQYEVDGQLYNAYDPTVNEDATTIIVDWKDANGEWHRTEFKRECGGQIIHRHPVAESSMPMGGVEYTPQTVTTDYVPPVTYTEIPPQGGGTPPTGTPPVNPPVNPPEGGTPPPTILEPKVVAADINANSDLPEYLQMGDQAGTIQPGELDTKPVAPPVEYIPDPAPSVSTEIANGAAPNDRTEVSGGTPEVVVPAPEAGVSGEAPTDVVTGRVEG